MGTTLRIVTAGELPGSGSLVLVGTRQALSSQAARDAVGGLVEGAVLDAMVAELSPDQDAEVATTWSAAGEPRRVVLCAVDERVSRANAPSRPWAFFAAAQKGIPKKGDVTVVALLDAADHALATSIAVARALPSYRVKTGSAETDRTVTVRLVALDGGPLDAAPLQHAADAVREAGRLVDMPTTELHTHAFVDKARTVGERTGATVEVLEVEELTRRGFGGLASVGRAAERGPALVVLTHDPEGATETLAWVGKGIVYDTGGLSLKGKTNMPGMKGDMGGAAAVLCAFEAAVRSGATQRIHAVLCLAENAIGPGATRPDDVITLYSGRTVEVNNTDAEGRLVLGDGVAYASRQLAPDVIIDLATLTGAQLIATGRRHAAVVCNDEALEAAAVRAGRLSGDLVHPLPYCPEFYAREFESKVADMKNSVKDRENAQSSCAAQFVAEHLAGYTGPWLHVDLAGPATAGERGTGFGVGLLLALLSR